MGCEYTPVFSFKRLALGDHLVGYPCSFSDCAESSDPCDAPLSSAQSGRQISLVDCKSGFSCTGLRSDQIERPPASSTAYIRANLSSISTRMLHRLCPTCQSTNEATVFFCASCGTSISHVEPVEKAVNEGSPPDSPTTTAATLEAPRVRCPQCGLEQQGEPCRCARCDYEISPPTKWFAVWPWGEETQIVDEMLIGRDTSPEWLRRRLNQLGLDNVSRQHARITVLRSAASVTDLDSSNGTFLDGVPIAAHAETPVTGNRELRFGASLRVTLLMRSSV